METCTCKHPIPNDVNDDACGYCGRPFATHDHEDIEAARHEMCEGCIAASKGYGHRFID